MILTIKQKMLNKAITALVNKIHHKTDSFTDEYCKNLVKLIVNEIYRINPDRKTGRIAVNWFDEKYNKTFKIDNTTYCFEINFYDLCTDLPWLICRFYRNNKAIVYCCN